ncbi:N-glycosylase/DNA lyase isoform X2 [Aricia agestis]|uniref:N-glycosylase/DNA lyase isoform X1 n=1 Tax=Aricia agestis TaxID=91739 RepID=UPI001C20660B|nr:N-glycosylase/DNA lyase isoform X1 [Aricia agestis]XP_041971961.1 N-glycosylase/DNA lyase isoform X2 [Aricia agestis]
MSWNKLCNKQDLQLLGTLSGGQSFRWKYNEDLKEWRGVFFKTAWKLRENEKSIEYDVIGSLLQTGRKRNNKGDITNETYFKKVLDNYFRLDCNLNEYYKEWSEKDELFKSACKQFYGIRMLNQEPVENLFSFICSQNNHISRISSMVEKLCENYGEKICNYEDTTYYAFPDVEKLAPEEVDKALRNLGFGYRAKFIQKSAAQILEWGGEKWFETLKEMKYKDAKQELIKLCGIGPKVADCICLMSLNHLESLPVDTHVYQIAAQNYLPHLRGKKSVTDKMYTEIGDHFRQLFGDKAGWAHTILFCADLKKFQTNTETEEKPKRKKKK